MNPKIDIGNFFLFLIKCSNDPKSMYSIGRITSPFFIKSEIKKLFPYIIKAAICLCDELVLCLALSLYLKNHLFVESFIGLQGENLMNMKIMKCCL